VAELTVDKIKYPRLNDEELTVSVNGKQHVYLVHDPTHIQIDADSRHTLSENWDFAQKALTAALEHREAADTNTVPTNDQ
jgi:hypothetical protein